MQTRASQMKGKVHSVVMIEVRELEDHPTEVVRQVKSGETVQLVEDGKPIATIIPVAAPSPGQDAERPYTEEEGRAFLAELERLAAAIGKYWPENVSAVDAVRDVRREL